MKTQREEAQPLISVIVPVYRVEPWLRGCLDSVTGQSWTRLQILLIDDGSPDGCGAICEEYAARDGRITVVHQENRGLSGAWNTGLALAQGEWIGFVDSDDWIEPDMYEYLVTNALREGTDAAVCAHWEEYARRQVLCRSELPRRMEPGEILARMTDCSVQHYVWNKLWKRELFASITFPGKNSADIAVTPLLLARAARGVLYLPEPKYHYRFLTGSISGDRSLARRVNFRNMFLLRRAELWDDWPALRERSDALCVEAGVRIWCAYLANPRRERRRFAGEIRETARFAREHYGAAVKLCRLGITGRAVMALTRFDRWWAFLLSALLGLAYRIKHERSL